MIKLCSKISKSVYRVKLSCLSNLFRSTRGGFPYTRFDRIFARPFNSPPLRNSFFFFSNLSSLLIVLAILQCNTHAIFAILAFAPLLSCACSYSHLAFSLLCVRLYSHNLAQSLLLHLLALCFLITLLFVYLARSMQSLASSNTTAASLLTPRNNKAISMSLLLQCSLTVSCLLEASRRLFLAACAGSAVKHL